MRRSDHATELPDLSNALAVEFNLVGLYIAQISDKLRTGICTHFLTSASRTGRHCSRRFLSEISRLLAAGNWLLFLLMPRAQQIHIKPHGSGHSRRQLPKERIAGVNVGSLAVLRLEQPALLRVLARIMAG
jgi:hypothetical protein